LIIITLSLSCSQRTDKEIISEYIKKSNYQSPHSINVSIENKNIVVLEFSNNNKKKRYVEFGITDTVTGEQSYIHGEFDVINTKVKTPVEGKVFSNWKIDHIQTWDNSKWILDCTGNKRYHYFPEEKGLFKINTHSINGEAFEFDYEGYCKNEDVPKIDGKVLTEILMSFGCPNFNKN
jgi:hypothetical protein